MPINYYDAVHGPVSIPDEFRPILESRVLARLRNIRQLGFTLARYPGAVHTRFEHTIGTTVVLLHLMKQFGVEDRDAERPYLRAALLSEIGIYPLSYSTRPIFKEISLTKRGIARQLYQAYLDPELGLTTDEQEFLFNPERRKASWFEPVSNLAPYSYLDPIKLASTIDYVVRDSYFTGRMVGGFDYRYFSSIGKGTNVDNSADIFESLRALHRGIHILNQTYGDLMRRALTQILYELIMRLHEKGFFDLHMLRDTSVLLSLDDDEFLYRVSAATEEAEANGDKISKAMYWVITQRVVPRAVEILTVENDFKEGSLVDYQNEVKKQFAKRLECDVERVLLIGGPIDDRVGFRMFGSEFKNQEEALRSDMFSKCTGLSPDLVPQEGKTVIGVVVI